MIDVIGEILIREDWPVYTNRPADRGGPTKGGITLKTLSGFLGRQATIEELQALEETTARQIYESIFIIRPGFIHIPDAGVREYLIDIGVTSGPSRATRYLQHVLGLKEDGVLGPATMAALRAVDQRGLLLRLVARRCRMMASDVQDNPGQLENLEGWINRAVLPLDQL